MSTNQNFKERKENKTYEEDFSKVTPNSSSNTKEGYSKLKGSKEAKSCKRSKNRKDGNNGDPRGIKFNHPQWFMPNDTIGEQIASIPFNVVAGGQLKLSGCSALNTFDRQSVTPSECFGRVQSVMTINYFSTPGISTEAISGINMAASKIYAEIRSKNSGAKVYEAADVMMYILLMQDIYANLCSAFRVIGISNYFTFLDKNVPDTLGEALVLNLKEVRANRANYLARINTMIEKVNSFAVPANLKVFQRSAYINTNVFKDSESTHGQYYVFQKENFYRWSAKTNTKGTELKCNLIGEHIPNGSLSNLLDIIDSQINDLFLDSDILTISADILKAFDNVNLYKFKLLDSDFSILPAYDINILGQIHNMNWLNLDVASLTMAQFDITQSNQLLIYQPYFMDGEPAAVGDAFPFYVNDRVFDAHNENPDYKDVLEGTRLQSTYKIDNTNNRIYVKTCGTELPMFVSVCYRRADGLAVREMNIPMILIRYIGPNASNFLSSSLEDCTMMNKLSQFKMCPLRYQIVSTSNSAGQIAEWSAFDIVGDTQFTTNLPANIIENINNVVLYAMYILE